MRIGDHSSNRQQIRYRICYGACNMWHVRKGSLPFLIGTIDNVHIYIYRLLYGSSADPLVPPTSLCHHSSSSIQTAEHLLQIYCMYLAPMGLLRWKSHAVLFGSLFPESCHVLESVSFEFMAMTWIEWRSVVLDVHSRFAGGRWTGLACRYPLKDHKNKQTNKQANTNRKRKDKDGKRKEYI